MLQAVATRVTPDISDCSANPDVPPTHHHPQAEAKVDQLKSDNTSAMIQHAQALMDLDSTRRSLLASHALRLTQALELPFTRVQDCMPVAKRQALEEAIADESRRRVGVTRDADSEREEVRAGKNQDRRRRSKLESRAWAWRHRPRRSRAIDAI